MNNKYLTVSAISRYLKSKFDSDDDVKNMINGVLDKLYHEKEDHE